MPVRPRSPRASSANTAAARAKRTAPTDAMRTAVEGEPDEHGLERKGRAGNEAEQEADALG